MVTLITPVYNAEKFLTFCADSIFAQTFADFEWLLVDDGSTDSSGKICDGLSEKDCRVKVLHQKNQGQASARNHALDAASGEYIAFVDSDDYIHPKMLEVLLKNAQKHDAQVSVCGYRSVSDYGQREVLKTAELKETLWSGQDFLQHCLLDGVDKKPWVLWDKLFHRSCFENVRMPEGRIYEDNAVVYKILYEAQRVVDCDAPLYYYFQNPDSTVNQSFKAKHLDWLLVPQEMIAYFAENQDDLLWDKANKMYLNALVDCYQKAHTHINNPKTDMRLREQLRAQLEHEKKRYPISLKTHPQAYEVLYPHRMQVYWMAKGILSKFGRKE